MTTIYIKRICEPFDKADGTWVLVDRLWPRAVTKRVVHIDPSLKDIASTPTIGRVFGRDPTRWSEFWRLCRDELQQQAAPIARLEDLSLLGPPTPIYAADDTVHNHARVLADYLEQLTGAAHVDPAA